MLDWFRHDIVDSGRLPLLCCLIAFLLTFLITRITVRFIRSQKSTGASPKWWQPRNVHVGTKHIHHVVFGVILVLVSGVTLVTEAVDGHQPQVTLAAIGFGIGAALVLDEYASILHLADVYWEEDGRASVDAVFAATAVTGLLVLGFHPLTFVLSFWHDTSSLLVRIGVFSSLVLTLPLAVVVLLKGKVWTGLSGMFFYPLLVVGAIRLSRPHAPWARWRYLTRRDKLRQSLARERQLRRPVVRVKLWLQDAVAGRPQVPDEVTVTAALDREVRAASAPTVRFMIRPAAPVARPPAAPAARPPEVPARPPAGSARPPAWPAVRPPDGPVRSPGRPPADPAGSASAASAPTVPIVRPRTSGPGGRRRR